ncbi:MAG: FG-GAP repeat protein [Acidobacteriota bacterium]
MFGVAADLRGWRSLSLLLLAGLASQAAQAQQAEQPLEREIGRFGAADLDGDGVDDELDNCRCEPNPMQDDRDADGSGDACDACPDVSWEPSTNRLHGRAVAVSRRVMVTASWTPGRVHLHERSDASPDGWVEVQVIETTDGWESWFGADVAASGDLVVIGAPSDDEAAVDAGAVHVYARGSGETGTWDEVAKLVVEDARSSEGFGSSVAVDGDLIVAGASDAAHVFRRASGGGMAWTRVARLTTSDPMVTIDRTRVAVSGDVVVVGTRELVGADTLGKARVYDRDAGGPEAWGAVAVLTEDEAPRSFGRAVEVSGDVIVVGAPVAQIPFSPSGAAYVYYRDAGGPDAWGRVDRILNSGAPRESISAFGESLALEGDVLAIGASMEDLDPREGESWRGTVSVFRRDVGGPDAWGRVVKLRADLSTPAFLLGTDLALSGDVIVAGDGLLGFHTGFALVFERCGATDADFDRIDDACDNCPGVANEEQLDPDADGLGAACDNCPLDFNDDQVDADDDDVGEACDCDDLDPTAGEWPSARTELRVGSELVTWTALAELGSSAVHDVLVGDLDALHASGSFAETTCLVMAAPEVEVTTSLLPESSSYLLVRSSNACALGSWGSSTGAANPRSGLDAMPGVPCP